MSEKKIVLITGATRGIGLAILKEMSNHNYIVLGTGTNENSVNTLKNELKVNKIEGKAYLLDIKNQDSVNNLLENIASVNNSLSSRATFFAIGLPVSPTTKYLFPAKIKFSTWITSPFCK